MRRRAVLVGFAVTAVAASLIGSAGAAAAAQKSPARIVLAPNHHLSAKPGGGGHGGGGGGGTSWPGWASSNWSGYAVTNTTYTSASGHWTVPTVAPTRSGTYSAAWVGIGGFNDAALIQTGTEQDFVNGHAVYAAWWTSDQQGYAETAFNPSVSVQPADTITASVAQNNDGSWTITLTDVTNGQTGTQVLTGYTNPGLSAEWIMEAPGIGGRTAPLAHFSTDTFDPGSVNGNHSPAFAATDGGELIQKSTVVSIPSNPDSDHDGFNIAYGSSQPAAP